MKEIEEHIIDLYVNECIMRSIKTDAFSQPSIELINRIEKEAKKGTFYTMPLE